MTTNRDRFATCLLLTILLPGVGCTRMYYSVLDKLGKEKRDILVSRIVDGRKDQEKAREQIKTTMEAFKDLTGFEGGNLERVYNKLDGEYKDSKNRADDLISRNRSIDKVANDLFREWAKETDNMRDASLKSQSRSLMRETQRRHDQYMTQMRGTEERMSSVVKAFEDQVLFLKHNLNARAIGSLKGTMERMDKEVASLMVDIERSMKEADAMVQSLTNVPS